ncbi:MAG: glutaredoxin family protein [bacterium]
MVEVVFYTRAGCHLCDVAKQVVDAVRQRVAFALDVVDIDGDAALAARWNDEVPVVFVNGKKAFKYTVDAARFERLLVDRAGG